MTLSEQLQSLYEELHTLIDLEKRLRALTEFDRLHILINRSGEVLDLDALQFMEPLVNRTRSDLRDLTTRINSLLHAEALEMQKATSHYGPVTIELPEVAPRPVQDQTPPPRAKPEGFEPVVGEFH